MKQPTPMPRRAFIKSMASSAGVLLAGCSQTDPPTYGHVLRMGDLLTYKAHRLLLPAHSLAREYDHADISSVPAIGTTNPSGHKEHGAVYERHLANRFADWRLPIEGSVTRPRGFSLDELKRMPSRTQITRHTCEEGWSAIAQWTGVPLRSVLEVHQAHRRHRSLRRPWRPGLHPEWLVLVRRHLSAQSAHLCPPLPKLSMHL